MTLRRIVAAGLVLALAGRAGAAPNVITGADWLAKPDAESMQRYYPALAAQLGISGYSILHCKVNAQGLLYACTADTERPTGLGFGKAVLGLSSEFRMRPMTLNGQPVDGGMINIPVRFELPTPEATPEPPAPGSEEAARQAYRVVDTGKAVERSLESYEKIAKGIEGLGDDRAAAKTAADALRHASLARRDDTRTAYARAYATVFSESELAALADYQAAAGDERQNEEVFLTVEGQVLRDYGRDLATIAHAAFCAKQACPTAADVLRVWGPADPRDTSRVDNPQWISQPDPAALASAGPRLAGILGLNGVVRLTCKITDGGTLTGCVVDEEAPKGLGYGAVALQATQAYRLNPIQLNAGALGRKATVRIGFPAAEQPEPYRARSGSGRALALARQAFDADKIADQARLETELQAADFATNPPKGADSGLNDAAVDAYRAAAKQAMANYLEQSINNLSVAYSEQQLGLHAAFRATPAGKAQESRSKELGIALGGAQAFVADEITAEARAAFCSARDCSTGLRPVQSTAASSAPSTRKP
jgi:TonB-like protein